MNIFAATGVAMRGITARLDYLLYVGGKAIGSVEAKPGSWTLRGVETQSAKYVEGCARACSPYTDQITFPLFLKIRTLRRGLEVAVHPEGKSIYAELVL